LAVSCHGTRFEGKVHAVKIEYDATGSIIVQQTAGTGFTAATHTDRGQVTYGTLTLTARYPGTDLNGTAVRFTAAGTQLYLELLAPTTAAVQKTTVASNTTAGVVVAAINAAFGGTVLASTTNPAAIVAPGTATLANGIDPTISKNAQFKYPSVTSGGLFYFDQRENYVITQIEATFTVGGATPIAIDLVNLDDGLMPITTETGPLYAGSMTVATPGVTISDVKFQLLMNRALRVQIAAPGIVRVQVRREAPQPML
jgi:hypothetical protein